MRGASGMTSRARSFLKYAFAFTLLIFIVHRAGPEKIIQYLAHVSLLNFAFALVLVTLAQIFSALRMRFFFQSSGFPMSLRYGVILFYVGAFYNFLLPGGI